MVRRRSSAEIGDELIGSRCFVDACPGKPCKTVGIINEACLQIGLCESAVTDVGDGSTNTRPEHQTTAVDARSPGSKIDNICRLPSDKTYTEAAHPSQIRGTTL